MNKKEIDIIELGHHIHHIFENSKKIANIFSESRDDYCESFGRNNDEMIDTFNFATESIIKDSEEHIRAIKKICSEKKTKEIKYKKKNTLRKMSKREEIDYKQ
jgi:CRISPR/Cas system-associated exonuclease Cas4 (RecB family)